ncbi:MAG: hypothetical protein U5N85_07970 [Arcicella sp.]|nr:hypothetical protein [Arcicella sp.]
MLNLLQKYHTNLPVILAIPKESLNATLKFPKWSLILYSFCPSIILLHGEKTPSTTFLSTGGATHGEGKNTTTRKRKAQTKSKRASSGIIQLFFHSSKTLSKKFNKNIFDPSLLSLHYLLPHKKNRTGPYLLKISHTFSTQNHNFISFYFIIYFIYPK